MRCILYPVKSLPERLAISEGKWSEVQELHSGCPVNDTAKIVGILLTYCDKKFTYMRMNVIICRLWMIYLNCSFSWVGWFIQWFFNHWFLKTRIGCKFILDFVKSTEKLPESTITNYDWFHGFTGSLIRTRFWACLQGLVCGHYWYIMFK